MEFQPFSKQWAKWSRGHKRGRPGAREEENGAAGTKWAVLVPARVKTVSQARNDPTWCSSLDTATVQRGAG